jgi:sugar lactone lactonase YvrE
MFEDKLNHGVSVKNILDCSKYPKLAAALFALLFFFHLCPLPAQTAPVRGNPGDGWADVVLGQLDFGAMMYGTMGNTHLCRPAGAFVDRTSNPQRLYVYDSANNRILCFSDISTLHPNQSAASGFGADIVLGQQDFAHTYANGDSQLQNFVGFPFGSYLSLTDPLPDPTASTLCLLDPRVVSPGESGSVATLAVDSQGNLYVTDFYNNRVLRYDAPTYTGEAASSQWGQPDFSGYRPNQGGSPTSSSLCFINQRGFLAAGVDIDDWGNLWVTDTGNDRVMRFPNPNAPAPGVPAATADIILGQTGSPAALDTDWSRFYYPGSVRVDSHGNVFVADGPPSAARSEQGGRVLIFTPQSFSGGLPQYASGQAASGWITYGLSWPTGLEFDASGNLWVNNSMVQIIQYSLDYSSTPPAATARKVLLTPRVWTGGGMIDPTSADGPDFSNYAYPPGSTLSANVPDYFHENWGGLGVDQAGNVFATFINNMVDVMRYPAPIPDLGTLPVGQAHAPDIAVFKTLQNPGIGGNIPVTYNTVSGMGLAVGASASVTQLIAADNHRLAYWNLDYSDPPSLGLTNGKDADGFAGTTASTVNFQAGAWFQRIWVDRASPQPHLWVVRGGGGSSPWVEIYNLPLTPWATAPASIVGPLPVLGGGTFTWGERLDGIATDPGGNFLWLSDPLNNRVFRVRNPLTSPQVDIVLGQLSTSVTGCNQGGTTGGYCGSCSKSASASSLYMPGALVMDHHGDLVVSDFSLECWGNQRILRWDAGQFPATPSTCLFAIPANEVYGRGGDLTSGYGQCPSYGTASLSPCGPFQTAFRSDDQVMVVGQMGYNGARWPLAFYNSYSSFGGPATYLNDFTSMAYSAVFDDQDNLFQSDPDRARVLVYWHPFPDTLPPTATPTPTACACPATQLTYGSTGSGTGNGVVSGAGQIAVGTTNGIEYFYIADINHSRVEQFNANTGSWVAHLTGVGTGNPYGGMSNPYGAALSPDAHYLFVANTNGANVVKLDMTSGGAPVTAFGVVHPIRLAVDEEGSVYVTDDYTVKKFVETSSNHYSCVVTLGTPGVSGSGNTQFNKPYNVLPLGNDLFIADNANARIVRWMTTDGIHYSYADTVYTSSSGAAFEQMVLEPGTTRVHVGSDWDGYFIFDMSTTPWTLLFQCFPSGNGNSTNGAAVDANWVYLSLAPGGPAGRYPIPLPLCMTPVTLPTNTPTFDLAQDPTATPTPTPTGTISPTDTPTPTMPPTETKTPTPTFSSTFTGTPTSTSTFGSTDTITPTPTTSATFTRTASATATPSVMLTASPSPTVTRTVTVSPTPTASSVSIGLPYPNPIKGPGNVFIEVEAPPFSNIKWTVFTTAFRKILDTNLPLTGSTVLQWGQRDMTGTQVANGLYYIRIEVVTDQGIIKKILKVIVLQ